MRRRRLLGWIMPAVLVAILVYVGGVMTGHWPDPTVPRGADRAYPESTDPRQRKVQAELCPLINQPAVLDLVERPATVKSTSTSYDPDGAWYECTVSMRNSMLRLTVAPDHMPLSTFLRLYPQAQPRTVLGRPAATWVEDSPIMNLASPGLSASYQKATLAVAWNRADSGGWAAVDIFRRTADPDDETALMRIAERQLPALPGWLS